MRREGACRSQHHEYAGQRTWGNVQAARSGMASAPTGSCLIGQTEFRKPRAERERGHKPTGSKASSSWDNFSHLFVLTSRAGNSISFLIFKVQKCKRGSVLVLCTTIT